MLENRRYKRYDVSKDKIAVQMYDVNGFSFLGYIQDISRGGLLFSTKSAIRWKENERVTLYVTFPGSDQVTAMDVVPVRSKRKMFTSYHAGEFYGTPVTMDALTPVLKFKAEKELVLS